MLSTQEVFVDVKERLPVMQTPMGTQVMTVGMMGAMPVDGVLVCVAGATALSECSHAIIGSG